MATPRAHPSSATRRSVSPPPIIQEPHKLIGDEFKRGKEIGKGSFATVYLAQHVKKKSYAAVKAVHSSKLVKDKLKVNLMQEIGILKGIKHPHCVALFHVAEKGEWLYMVMEYCQLSDLSQFFKKRHNLARLAETADIFRKYPNPPVGGFNEVLSRHFMKQITSALKYLREKNVLHRDIKPQNLLLNPSPAFMARQRPEDIPLTACEHSLMPAVGVRTLPTIKIADFGFARFLPELDMAETLCGSPLYMAPEILRYEKYDAQVDLWSTGTVLFEMVAGKPPFRAANHMELLKKIDANKDKIEFEKNIAVSREMSSLIGKLLTKSPLERISYTELFEDPVIINEIPGLVGEDKPKMEERIVPQPELSELSRKLAKRSEDHQPTSRPSSERDSKSKALQADLAGRTTRKPSDQSARGQHKEDRSLRRPSNTGESPPKPEGLPVQRRTSDRDVPKQRRPSMVAHATAPARQDLLSGPSNTAPQSKIERRSSRSSPLAGPPMVREPSGLVADKDEREARERTAQEVAFEKEYVVIEKRAVEVNAFADELSANQQRYAQQQHPGSLTRRATTQGRPAPVAGVQPSSPSRAIQVSGRNQIVHQRASSYDKRVQPNGQSLTKAVANVLNAANARFFGTLGTSPPFGHGTSPPYGYNQFPTYPAPQGVLLLGDGNEGKGHTDEDAKIVRIMEDAAHRSDVVYSFAEIKYKQLLPATPSAHSSLGNQNRSQGEREMAGSEELTVAMMVNVSEEALVLYVKTLGVLAKTIDLAGHWWNKQTRGEVTSSHAPSGSASPADVSKRMNSIVQWARTRFNECLEKSEIVGRKLQAAQKELFEDSPDRPEGWNSGTTSNSITTSAEHIHITSGVTAEKQMFERAVEMSRDAAVRELMNDRLQDCEIDYATAIQLLEAVLESEDEPLTGRPSVRKDRSGDESVNGLENGDRKTVIKLIEGARSRLHSLRKKLYAAQHQQLKRSPRSASGHATPRAALSGASPIATPAAQGTPPK